MNAANLQKSAIRDQMRDRRERLDGDVYDQLVILLNERLIEELTPPEIAVFASIRKEPAVYSAVQHWREHLNCVAYYPRVTGEGEMEFARVDDEDDLVEGKFGIPEPAADAPTSDIESIGALLLPGLAFDARGARVGYGGGYYDRALSRTFKYPPTMIGVCFDFQVVDEVPDEEHDVRVDWIITDSRMIETSKSFRFPDIH